MRRKDVNHKRAGPGGGRRRAGGQVLVIAALLLPALLLLFVSALGIMGLLDARAHARDALATATRAGARRVEYADLGQAGTAFVPAEVQETVRDTFERSLALRTAGLADTPEDIARDLHVLLGYGAPGRPWENPYTGREHQRPVVAARVPVPLRVGPFELVLAVDAESEVR